MPVHVFNRFHAHHANAWKVIFKGPFIQLRSQVMKARKVFIGFSHIQTTLHKILSAYLSYILHDMTIFTVVCEVFASVKSLYCVQIVCLNPREAALNRWICPTLFNLLTVTYHKCSTGEKSIACIPDIRLWSHFSSSFHHFPCIYVNTK